MWSCVSLMPKEKHTNISGPNQPDIHWFVPEFHEVCSDSSSSHHLDKKYSVYDSAILQPCVGICWPPHATGHHMILYTIHHTNQNNPAAHKTKLKGHENQPAASQDFHCEGYEMNLHLLWIFIQVSAGAWGCGAKNMMSKNMMKNSVMVRGPTPLFLPCRVGSKRGSISIFTKYGTSEHQFWIFLGMQSQFGEFVAGWSWKGCLHVPPEHWLVCVQKHPSWPPLAAGRKIPSQKHLHIKMVTWWGSSRSFMKFWHTPVGMWHVWVRNVGLFFILHWNSHMTTCTTHWHNMWQMKCYIMKNMSTKGFWRGSRKTRRNDASLQKTISILSRPKRPGCRAAAQTIANLRNVLPQHITLGTLNPWPSLQVCLLQIVNEETTQLPTCIYQYHP